MSSILDDPGVQAVYLDGKLVWERYGMSGWQAIETAPREKSPMIVVCGVFADRHYVTDPWCVFWQEGAWQRWPHKDPPTHWMPLPPLLDPTP